MKNGILLSTLLSIGTSLGSPLWLTKNNNFTQISNKTQLIPIHKNYEDNKIINFDNLVSKAIYATVSQIYPLGLGDLTNLTYDNLKVSDVNVTPIGQPEISHNSTAIFMGSNTFNNTYTIPETWYTDQYEKEVTNSISSTTTRGLSLDIGANYEFLNDNIQVSFSKSETNVKTKTVKVVAPPQKVYIPPHKKYKVSVYLGQNQAKVKLDLHARISGRVSCNFSEGPDFNDNERDTFSIDLATAFQFLNKLPEGITIDSKTNEVVFDGVAIAQDVTESDTFSVSIEPVN